MDNKIVKARLGKAPIKLPPVAGKTPRAEHIRVSKTKTKRRTKSGKSNKGKNTLAAKDKKTIKNINQAINNSNQASNNSLKKKQRQHQPTYDSDLSEELNNKR